MKTPMNEPITMFKKTIQLSQHSSTPFQNSDLSNKNFRQFFS